MSHTNTRNKTTIPSLCFTSATRYFYVPLYVFFYYFVNNVVFYQWILDVSYPMFLKEVCIVVSNSHCIQYSYCIRTHRPGCVVAQPYGLTQWVCTLAKLSWWSLDFADSTTTLCPSVNFLTHVNFSSLSRGHRSSTINLVSQPSLLTTYNHYSSAKCNLIVIYFLWHRDRRHNAYNH